MQLIVYFVINYTTLAYYTYLYYKGLYTSVGDLIHLIGGGYPFDP